MSSNEYPKIYELNDVNLPKLQDVSNPYRSKRKRVNLTNGLLYKVSHDNIPEEATHNSQCLREQMETDFCTIENKEKTNQSETKNQNKLILDTCSVIKYEPVMTKNRENDVNNLASFKISKRSANDATFTYSNSKFLAQNSSFKKEKLSTSSPIKASLDFASNSIKNIRIKHYNFEAQNKQFVSPRIPNMEKYEDSINTFSTISSQEFKEVIDSSIHQAALRSKRAKEFIKNSIEKSIIFENDMLNHNLQLSFLPLIEKQKYQIRDKSIGNTEPLASLNARSVKQRSINQRNKNVSIMNARKSDIALNFGSSALYSNRNDKPIDLSSKNNQPLENDHLVPKPIKDPRYIKIKNEFKKMLEQSKMEKGTDFQGSKSKSIERQTNFKQNCQSPIFQPKSKWMKKLSRYKKNLKSRAISKQPTFRNVEENIELEGVKKHMESTQKEN